MLIGVKTKLVTLLPFKNCPTFVASALSFFCASSNVGASVVNEPFQTTRSDLTFFRVEPFAVMNCEFLILIHAVVASIEDKTSPTARKSPASIPKSWGRELFMVFAGYFELKPTRQ